MLFSAGLIISGFLFVLLLIKKGKTRGDIILTMWMGVIALHLMLFYGHFSGWCYLHPHTLGLVFPIPVLHGVLLYLYTRELTLKESSRLGDLGWHFVPFGALIALAIPFYMLPAAEKIKVFQSEGKGFEWYTTIQFVLIIVTGVSYTLASVFQIYRHRKRLEHFISNTDRQLLRWLEYLSAGLGAIWLLVLFFDDDVIFMGVAGLVLFIGFLGINQVPVFSAAWAVENDSVFQPMPSPAELVMPTPEKQVRYAKSGLSDHEVSGIFERLQELMDKNKRYTDPDLTLADLAKELEVHPNNLSQAINSKANTTFYHFVNTLRIEAFLQMACLPQNRQYTFLALAYDCGFNSKSTFNKYFKAQTGKTPSAYFQTQNKDNQIVII